MARSLKTLQFFCDNFLETINRSLLVIFFQAHISLCAFADDTANEIADDTANEIADDTANEIADDTTNEIYLNFGNGAEPQTLDPHMATGVPESHVITALFEGLVGAHPRTLEPTNDACAESWQISTDGLKYIFKIRKNATWTNGDRVTPEDFVYSYKRMLDPNLPSDYAYMLYPIKNAREYKAGEIKDFSQVGIKAINTDELEITLTSKTPYFLGLLSHPSCFPVHKKSVEKYGSPYNPQSPWARKGRIVGNGAFELEDWKINAVLKVKRRDDYWDAKNNKLAGVNFFPISNLETEQRAFRAGALHITNSPPPHRIVWAKKNMPENLLISEYLGVFYLLINLRPTVDDTNLNNVQKKAMHALAKTEVRQALSLAIDRKAICDYLRGGQKEAYHFTPPGAGGYFAKNNFAHNPQKARQLLEKAGYPNGENFPAIEMLYNGSETNRQMSALLQATWKKELNIDVRLSEQQWKVYLDSTKSGDFQLARAAWIGDYNDPMTFLDLWVSGGGNNRCAFNDKSYDQAIKAASQESDQRKRFAHFDKAEQLLAENAPIIPIYFYVRVAMISKKVKGWLPNILDYHPWKYLEIVD